MSCRDRIELIDCVEGTLKFETSSVSYMFTGNTGVLARSSNPTASTPYLRGD